MAQGRKPKPDVLKALAGNPGKRPLSIDVKKSDDVDSVHSVIALAPPAWLSKGAAEIWNSLALQMQQAGFLNNFDEIGFGQLCDQVNMYRIASKDVEENGTTFKYQTKHGPQTRINPSVKIKNDAFKNIRITLSEFGMSPMSRQRLGKSIRDQLSLPLDEAHPHPTDTKQPATNDPIGKYLN